jgi:membrane protein required for colicin V production
VNWLDYFLLIVLIFLVIRGFWKGFSRQVIGLAAAILGLVLAFWTYGIVGAFLAQYLSSRSLARILGFLLVFVAVQIAGRVLGWAMAKLLRWTGLGLLDRLGGTLFGAAEAAIVAVALVLVLVAFPLSTLPDAVAGSRSAPYVIEAAHVLVSVAPRDLHDRFTDTYQKLQDFWRTHSAPVLVRPEKANPRKTSPDPPAPAAKGAA